MLSLGLITAILFFIAGMAGIFLPILPGAPLIVAGMVAYGLLEGFAPLTWHFFLGQLILMFLVFGVDYLAGMWGVKKYGGSNTAVWGSVIGALVGLVFLGPLGIILGPFLGAVGGELIAKGDINLAVRAGIGTLLGFLGGALVKLVIQIIMIVWFFTAIN